MKKKSSSKGNRDHILWRYFLISVVIFLFAGSIAVKLFSNTVVNADKWNAKAREEMGRVSVIKPERGEILADDGNVLATNLRYYTVRLDYRSERFTAGRLLMSVDSLADSLATHFPKHDRDKWKEILTAPLSKPDSARPRALTLLRNLSYAELELARSFPFLNQRNRNRSGLTVESSMRRRNPYGDMARRSIGSISEDSATGEIHGMSGLEMALDSLLYGVPGKAKKIALTHNIVNWTDIEPQRGYDIKTTIDINMQDIVENELNAILEEKDADWGVAVLMEVKTGYIKAISNLEKDPRDPSRYIEGMNRAVLGFEPGSVVKTLSMLVALEDGIVTNLGESIPTGGSWAYGGGKAITDSHYTSALRVDEVLEHSSNIAMARIITRRYGENPSAYYKRIERLGFFDPMRTGIAGERIPNFPRDPSRLTLSRVSYGYATEIPPLSTLAIYNAIANDGKYVRPSLVRELIKDGVDSVLPIRYIRDSVCSTKNARILREMLHKVVWGDHGTGKLLRNQLVDIAGKTGTSYMVDSGRYNTSQKRLTFCGFFPADKPQYSCIVLTCRPREGMRGAAATSGMVLKNIALKMYSRGMLGNSSDYRDNPARPGLPAAFATRRPGRLDNIKEGLEVKNMKHFAQPSTCAAGTVPSVVGMGLREAVVAMESAGYNVAFSGSGYVASQSPAAGTRATAGTRVKITLSHQ